MDNDERTVEGLKRKLASLEGQLRSKSAKLDAVTGAIMQDITCMVCMGPELPNRLVYCSALDSCLKTGPVAQFVGHPVCLTCYWEMASNASGLPKCTCGRYYAHHPGKGDNAEFRSASKAVQEGLTSCVCCSCCVCAHNGPRTH